MPIDPLTVIMMASAAIKFAKEAVPAIREMFQKDLISVEQQAEVRAHYESLRRQLGGEFTGPEWELSGR